MKKNRYSMTSVDFESTKHGIKNVTSKERKCRRKLCRHSHFYTRWNVSGRKIGQIHENVDDMYT